MSDPNHPHEHAHGPGGHAAPRQRKLHRDWRLWLIVVVLLGAMIIYVLTLDLR